MKKAIILFAISLAFLSFDKPQPKFTVKLTDEEVKAVLHLIDNSKADHLFVKEVQALLVKQLQPQYDSLNKAAIDTIKKK